jgi:hypothetical protein
MSSPDPLPANDLRTAIAVEIDYIDTLVHTLERLYTSAKTIELMNRAAPAFFGQHQELLTDSIFLKLVRLYDPKGDKRGLNVSLPHLVEAIGKDELRTQLVEAKRKLGNLMTIRSKLIAHSDTEYTGSRLSESLSTVKAILQSSKELFNACLLPGHRKFNSCKYPAIEVERLLCNTIG